MTKKQLRDQVKNDLYDLLEPLFTFFEILTPSQQGQVRGAVMAMVQFVSKTIGTSLDDALGGPPPLMDEKREAAYQSFKERLGR